MSDGASPPSRVGIGTSTHTLLLAIKSGAAGAVFAFAFNIALLPFVLTRLGGDLYGAWIAMSAFLAVGALADVGVRTEVTRRVATAHGLNDRPAVARSVREGMSVMCVTVIPIMTVGLVTAPWLTGLVFPSGVEGYTSAELILILRALLSVLAINLVLGAYFSALRGLQRSDIEALAQIMALPVNAGVTVLGILAGLGLWSLFWAYVAGAATVAIVQWLAGRRIMSGIPMRIERISRASLTGFMSLSGLALLSQVSDVLDSQWDKLVLSRYVGSEAVTAFHVGTTLVLQGKVLALLPLAPLLVVIAELQTAAPERAAALQRNLMKVGAITTSVVMGGAFLLLPSFVNLWLGSEYEDAATVGRIFVIAVLLTLVGAPIALQAFAEGHHRLAALSALTNMTVNAALSLVLTMEIGLYGAVYGSVAGTLAGTSLLILSMRRRSEHWMPPPVFALSWTAMIVGVMTLTGLDNFDRWWALGLAAISFAVFTGVSGTILEGLSLGQLRAVLASARSDRAPH